MKHLILLAFCACLVDDSLSGELKGAIEKGELLIPQIQSRRTQNILN